MVSDGSIEREQAQLAAQSGASLKAQVQTLTQLVHELRARVELLEHRQTTPKIIVIPAAVQGRQA